MNPSVTLGRVAGVRISVNWSWLLVYTLIAWTPRGVPSFLRRIRIKQEGETMSPLMRIGGLPEDFHCDLELTAALEKRLQVMPVDALIDSSNSQIRLQSQLLKVADLVQLNPTHFLDALDHGLVTAETVIS